MRQTVSRQSNIGGFSKCKGGSAPELSYSSGSLGVHSGRDLCKTMSYDQPDPLIVQDMSEFYLRQLASSLQDSNLQQKIDHEIRMREGSRKLLAACHHSSQQLEAARSLLCSNNRIMAYMSALQQRKTQEALGHTQNVEGGNQLPCKARLCVSDIRIPLMWKDTDHFKNKGDYRRYAVFCLLKVGTEIFDTALMTGVDRSMTDITFENAILFEDIPHDFELSLELYCHKLHEELSVTNTPKKIRKTITSLSGSVGRSVGKRLSGLNDADVVRNMVLGPRFDLVAKGTLGLTDVDSCVQTFDFCLQKGNGDSGGLDLPLFGNYCCRLAAVPHCLFTPAVTGYLNLQEEDGDMCKWRTYWCVLENLQIGCWSSSSDHEVAEPLRAIPVNKSTQISDADPNICRCPYAFLIKTASVDGFSEHTLAADSKTEVDRWWLGFQQHLLDQALWKHTCDSLMEIKAPTKSKVPSSRTSSLYDETPLIELETVSDSIVSDFKMSDDQLSHMLTTLMGEANEIRGIHQS